MSSMNLTLLLTIFHFKIFQGSPISLDMSWESWTRNDSKASLFVKVLSSKGATLPYVLVLFHPYLKHHSAPGNCWCTGVAPTQSTWKWGKSDKHGFAHLAGCLAVSNYALPVGACHPFRDHHPISREDNQEKSRRPPAMQLMMWALLALPWLAGGILIISYNCPQLMDYNFIQMQYLSGPSVPLMKTTTSTIQRLKSNHSLMMASPMGMGHFLPLTLDSQRLSIPKSDEHLLVMGLNYYVFDCLFEPVQLHHNISI